MLATSEIPAATPLAAFEGEPDLNGFDHIVIAFSGGKDSLASLLHLFERGVPRDRIELRHHEVDGREGSTLMDWPSSVEYCREVAKALGVRLLFSWKEGGIEREMLRDNAPTAPTHWETRAHGLMTAGGKSQKLGTRLKFPQVSADLSCRWCSSYAKIDVLDKVLVNSPEYQGKRVLVVTGERAQESASRARYATWEQGRVHAPNRGRHVEHWRPIHKWSTGEVWAIIRRHGVVPHPAYYLGWGRLSCISCIFGSANQWATVRAISPCQFKRIAAYETQFNRTIHRKKSVETLANEGTPYAAAVSQPELVEIAMSREWLGGAVVISPEEWQLPAGAFGESTGPS
jgi:3'-phosphoadenosine 5'-phosphosulfate sulfotransferase (PAPS reductase)/FAD synthetase